MAEHVDGIRSQIAETVSREKTLLAELEQVRGTRRGLLEKLHSTLPTESAPITPLKMWQQRQQILQQQAAMQETPLFRDGIAESAIPEPTPINNGLLYPPGHRYWADLAESMDKR